MTEGREVAEVGTFERMKGILGDEKAQAFVKEFGGEIVRVPSLSALERISVITAVRYHFDRGMKVPELMERFNLPLRTVKRYLNGK